MDAIRSKVLPQYQALKLRAQVQPVDAFGAGNNAEIQFWIGGPDLDQLAKYSEVLLAKLQGDARAPSTSTPTSWSASPSSACTSTAPRPATSACACRTWRPRSTCWSAG